MSEVQPPKDQAPLPEELSSMGDIDKLLENEDPGFLKFLEEVRAVEADKSVVIDTVAVDHEESAPAERPVEKPVTFSERVRFFFRTRVRASLVTIRMHLHAALIALMGAAIVFLKTKPVEFAQYALKMSAIAATTMQIPVKMFRKATRPQKIVVVTLAAMAITALWVLVANFKGIWIPQLNPPLLYSLETNADMVETYDPKDGGESFYSAFPQDKYEFLFPKFKVNLRATNEHPNPMGAFEVIIELDSNDAAIEVRDREVEYHDQMQRVFEDESFVDLESELGKSKLKSRIKRELNQTMTQGWAKDVKFKTFVLKP